MSKHYWDEYLNFFKNSNEHNRILKFHQASNNIMDPHNIIEEDTNKKKWIELKGNNVIYSDTMIKRYFMECIDKDLKELFYYIKNIFLGVKINTTLPVLTLYKNKFGLDTGCYTFNFNDDCLVKYNELSKDSMLQEIQIKGISFSISYFISIEESIYVYGGAGYLKGILQIGKISEKINTYLSKKSFNIYDFFVPEQKFTHNIGLNLRKQLLIMNQFLGDNYDFCR